MKRHHHIFIRSVILLGFTLLLFKLMVTGNIYNYIAPKMLPYFYFALIVFMILGGRQFLRGDREKEAACGCNHEHTYSTSTIKSLSIYLLFIIPVISGFLFSEHTLGASVAKKKGYQFAQIEETTESRVEVPTENNQQEGVKQPEVPAEPDETSLENSVITPKDMYPDRYKEMSTEEKIVLNDDNYISTINLLEEEPETFAGKSIVIRGFVYREPNFPSSRIVVGRFGVSCCVADAGIYGIMAEGKQVLNYNEDTWIEVHGTVQTAMFNDWQLPIIELSSIHEIKKPKQTYVYEDIDYSNLEQ
ncbi:TIGR03943 family protein [Pontibacillus sp. ALD_SL1]|uniref:TIGR03943 family putative permease subunit n=1 Tax=Pontibacillus sp. ALD_SL1 TaxID=2777185 RepID=UPI001A97BF56|nr:TIGR03943 family protein [Pontibacillus sp. ALD_SL1]QST01327.1 TIGR03943 family protein [Pontibacillus sp. ALD_SL1]